MAVGEVGGGAAAHATVGLPASAGPLGDLMHLSQGLCCYGMSFTGSEVSSTMAVVTSFGIGGARDGIGVSAVGALDVGNYSNLVD